jgi:hypothetical protein
MDDSGSTIVAVGDVHGESAALREILRHAKVLGNQEQWIGENTILVQTGDVIDRGPDSRGAYKLLEKLQSEAARAGGTVVRLLGNHELGLLQGEDYLTDVLDWRCFQRILAHDVRCRLVTGAFAGQGYLFTHAGVRSEMRSHLLRGEAVAAEDQLLHVLTEKINRTVLQAVEHNDFSDKIFRAGRSRGGDDPVGGIFWEDARELFRSGGAGEIRQVFGHTPVRGMRISPSERRVDIDAGLHYWGGRAYLTLRGGKVTAQKV